MRSKAVVEYTSTNNLRLIAEGLDAAFEPSHRSARRVEAGSYHHERRARRRADGHADALPRRGLCRLAGNAGSAFRRPAATSAYNDARTKLDDLQKQIDANEASIEEIEAKLPEQQAKASSAMRDLYKYQKGTNPIVSFLVNAQSLGEFITTCKYTNQITSSSVDEIEQLNNMQTELEQNKAELQQAKSQLEAEQKNAEDALAQAQLLRSEAQAKAEQENAAELAKLEADKAAAAEKLSGEGVSGSNSSSQATNTNTTIDTTVNNANTGSSDYDSFINEWTSRIDNYLAGSPMAGQGYNFAVAAWNTGVDPRWSPAIACIESTKGAYCANSYNAWGWSARGGGWRSFGSWSEGISAHVAYLGANYGSTLTPAAAKKYCPPTWQDWYNKVAAQMNRI